MEFWLNAEHEKHIGLNTPETSDRLRLIDKSLCIIKSGKIANYESYFTLAHSPEYLERLKKEEIRELEAYCNKGSYDAMGSGAALCLEAADMRIAKNQNIFLLTRPPGHHAQTSFAHGFCFINNSALTAAYLNQKHGKRVAVLDFDLHHGDGTEEILNKLGRDVLFISTYDANNFPGPKYNLLTETVRINTYHLPITRETHDHSFKPIIKKIGRKLKEFSPEILVISAGFDMNIHDSNSNLMSSNIKLTKESYKSLQEMCLNYPSLMILEGGYSPLSIKEGLDAFDFEL